MKKIYCRVQCSALLVLLTLLYTAAALPAHAQSTIDPGSWYRLANEFLGAERALEINAADQSHPAMGKAAQVPGQLWRLQPTEGEGVYQLTNKYLGDGLALDIDPGESTKLLMTPAEEISPGQLWEITPLGEGYYRLTNQSLEAGWALDTYGDGANDPFMGEMGDYAGQFWKLSPQGKVEASGTAAQEVGAPATDNKKKTGPKGEEVLVWEEKYPDGKTKFKYEYYVGGAQPKSEEDHIVRAKNDHAFAGYYKAYYETGKPVLEVNFKGGIPEGKWVGYQENGKVEWEVKFKDGKREGKWLSYSEDGTKYGEGQYVAGKQEGEWIWYDSEGGVLNSMIFKNGVCVEGCDSGH